MKFIPLIPISFPLLLLVSGCCPVAPEPDYKIPTDPMPKVVADINANNSKVPTLWAHHYYEADVIDEKKNSHHVSGDGVLLYISPMSMRLRASAVIGTVFEVGSNPKSFWLLLGPQAGDTMWYGDYANFEKMDPANAQIPIRPDMVLDVLGIATINKNFNELPVPVMRFDPYADAYVFVWTGKLPDRWVAMREVWYDRTTKLPKLVLLYDPNGRVVLRAEFNNTKQNLNGRPKFDLKNYRRVEVPGLPKDQWPWIPGNYHLFFPDSGSRLNFTLDEAELKRIENEVPLPDPRSFRMPSIANPGVGRLIQIGP